ncbi:MAG TPA: hypothetical protein VNA13_04490 [Xanthomonadales bacterium]|nr:hypothetical protein [Xanthomonadales bacterium]
MKLSERRGAFKQEVVGAINRSEVPQTEAEVALNIHIERQKTQGESAKKPSTARVFWTLYWAQDKLVDPVRRVEHARLKTVWARKPGSQSAGDRQPIKVR